MSAQRLRQLAAWLDSEIDRLGCNSNGESGYPRDAASACSPAKLAAPEYSPPLATTSIEASPLVFVAPMRLTTPAENGASKLNGEQISAWKDKEYASSHVSILQSIS